MESNRNKTVSFLARFISLSLCFIPVVAYLLGQQADPEVPIKLVQREPQHMQAAFRNKKL